MKIISETLAAAGVTEDALILNDFNVEVIFSNSGTVELQRKLVDSNDFVTVETITSTTSKSGYEVEIGTKYRFNVVDVTGDVSLRISG